MRLHRGLLALVPVLVACGSPGDDPLGTAQDAITVCAKGSTLQGIDVSHYDGTIDWAQVASSGRSFAFAKATEGDNDTDPTFATNWAGMKAAGVVRGAYHFFHCDTPAATQASYFLSVMPALEDGDLPPTLDFEDTTTCTASTGISLAVEWLDAVAKATGTLPILYSSPGILGGFSGTSALAGHAQLWVANWGVSCPTVPTPFTAWPFWQTSATGTVPGVPGSSGACDLDEFDGDLAALKAFAFGGATSTSASSSSSSSSSSAGSSPPACKVNGVDGTCIDVTTCDAMPGYVSTPGFCPGPASEECCTPTGGGSSSSSASTSSGSSSASSTSGTSGSTLASSSSSSGGGQDTSSSSSSSSGEGEGGGGACDGCTSSSGAGEGGAAASSGNGGAGASSISGTRGASASCSATRVGGPEGPSAGGVLLVLALSAFTRRSAAVRRGRRRGAV